MGTIYKVQNPYKWLGQPATAQNVVPASAGLQPGSDSLGRSISLTLIELSNRNSGGLNAALVGLLPDSMWQFGQIASTNAYTDDTADAQSAATNDAPLEAKADAGSGFIVGAMVPWGALSLDVTTAGVGGAQTHTYEYWNGAAWVTLTPVLIAGPTSAGQLWGAGENVLLFDPPVDWAKGGTGTGVPQNLYNVRVKMPVVGTTDALARRVYVGQVIVSGTSIAAAPGVYNPYPAAVIVLPPYIQALGGAFSVITVPNSILLVYDFGG